MQRPLKTLALTAAVTAALVSTSVQAETYVCKGALSAKIFTRNDDGKTFHTPAGKNQYREYSRVDYTTLRETDGIIWLYEIEFFAGDGDLDLSDRDVLHLHQISKANLSYIFYGLTGEKAGTEDYQFNGGEHTSCTLIP